MKTDYGLVARHHSLVVCGHLLAVTFFNFDVGDGEDFDGFRS